MPAEIPNWIQPADPASHMARGLSIGVQIGAQQAENAYRQAQLVQKAQQEQAQMSAEEAAQQFKMQQAARQEQQAAQDQALEQQRFQLQASTVADKSRAMMEYQAAVQGGMEPTEAILKFGPRMGQGTAEAAAIRAMQQSKKAENAVPVPMPEVQFADIEGRKIPYLVDKKTGRGTWAPSGALGKPPEESGKLTARERLRASFLVKDQKALMEQYPTGFDRAIAAAPTKERKAVIQADKNKLEAIRKELEKIAPAISGDEGTAAAAAPTQFKDKSGQVWNYTGTAADPKTDKDQSHWEPATQE